MCVSAGEKVYVCVCMCVSAGEKVYVCVCEREKSMRMCVLSLCVCVLKRKCMCVCVREKVYVCMRESESVFV